MDRLAQFLCTSEVNRLYYSPYIGHCIHFHCVIYNISLLAARRSAIVTSWPLRLLNVPTAASARPLPINSALPQINSTTSDSCLDQLCHERRLRTQAQPPAFNSTAHQLTQLRSSLQRVSITSPFYFAVTTHRAKTCHLPSS
jgi:hypothetical protein